jgi:hypothetical protein
MCKITGLIPLGRSESTPYSLRKDPRKRFELTVGDWKPEKKEKRVKKKISTGHYLIHSSSYRKHRI